MKITITQVNPYNLGFNWSDHVAAQFPQWGKPEHVPRDTEEMLTLPTPIVADNWSDAYDRLFRKKPELIARQEAHDLAFERAIVMRTAVEDASLRLLLHTGPREGLLDEEDYTLDEYNTIMVDEPTSPRWAGKEWTVPAPLIAVREVYEDNDLEPPSGNVLLVSAANERTLLESLQLLGEIHMTVEEND